MKYLNACLLLLIFFSCQPSTHTKALTPEEQALEDGKRMYMIRGCMQCHGVKGDGVGMRMARLNPPPRDFKDLGSYKQGHSLAEIQQTIKAGITNGPSAMPAYPFFSDAERKNLARYVIYLREQTTP